MFVFLSEIIREILENRAQTYTRLGEDYDQARETSKYVGTSPSEGETAIPTDERVDDRDVDFTNHEPVDEIDFINHEPVDDVDQADAL